MSQHRFYVHPKQIIDGNVFIRGTDVWHITKVLRLSSGAEVIVFDGTGREYLVKLGKHKPREVLGTVIDEWERNTESPLHLTLIQSVPKADKMDLIVQKASEIGVNVIIPLHTERSVINSKQGKLQGEAAAKKLDRWARIGIEAAKQSCRTAIPKIQPLLTIAEFLAQSFSADLRLLLWEGEQTQRLRAALREYTAPVQAAMIVVGPEGGLTGEEAEQFRTQGFQPVSLGKRILRTETVGIVALSILQYEYGDY